MRKQVIVGGREGGGNPILVKEEKKEGFVKTFQKEGGKDYPN